MLKLTTAGESHGKAVLALIDGFPAGVEIRVEPIDAELRRRQGGYGRGDRQRIEDDRVDILSGLRQGKTIGSPITLLVPNRDHRIDEIKDEVCPRPGHGDLSGSVKYLGSMCGIAERASARETAARTAAGALAAQLLDHFGISVLGYVVQIGSIDVPELLSQTTSSATAGQASSGTPRDARDRSELYTLDPNNDGALKKLIDDAAERGDTLGGIVEVRADGVPFGLGSHAQWDRRLDGRLAQAVMSVQSVKGVEIGLGFESARRFGSDSHDQIGYDSAMADGPTLGFTRPTNNAGGIEAGMSNSQPIVARAAVKPICTLANPLESVNVETKQPQASPRPRADVCAVPAASCVVENVVAFEIARAMIDKFGGDSLDEMKRRHELFHQMARERISR